MAENDMLLVELKTVSEQSLNDKYFFIGKIIVQSQKSKDISLKNPIFESKL